MDVKLVVVGGEAPATEYSLTLPSIVGRSRSADIKIGHPLVSRKHCELYESDGQVAVRDLGSLNGTFVGQERISEPVFLMPGATVTVGAVTFKAVYGDMEQAEAAAAGADEIPDFLAADNEPQASAVEQTIEMSGDAPATEPVEETSGGDGGFDFGWLEDAPEEDGGEQAVEAAVEPAIDAGLFADAEPGAEVEAVAEEIEPEAEFDLPLPDAEPVAEVEGDAGDEGSEFAPPDEQPVANDDENDGLDDFFASLK